MERMIEQMEDAHGQSHQLEPTPRKPVPKNPRLAEFAKKANAALAEGLNRHIREEAAKTGCDVGARSQRVSG